MKLIFCAGNNKQHAEIAIKHGWLYGIRHDHVAYFKPHFIDINWKHYDWNEYLEIIRKHRPEMAMVPDYEKPDKEGLLEKIAQMKEAGANDVLVCPKFVGAVDDIPDWCIVAISVPSSYAGFLPNPERMTGRKVHFLGGTPTAQMEMYRKYTAYGATVLSIDCNSFLKASHNGTYWEAGKWRNEGKRIDNIEAFTMSINNIRSSWNEIINSLQLPLL